MIKISTSDNSIDLASAIHDTIYCYDSTHADSVTMNTTSYPNINSLPASSVYITNNTGTLSPSWNINDTLTLGNISAAPLKVHGDAEIEGNLRVNGKDIGSVLEKLEERLAILHPNPELEDRWDKLKELGRRYKELEQDILEKEKIYNILKK